jgi:hypothetical protein
MATGWRFGYSTAACHQRRSHKNVPIAYDCDAHADIGTRRFSLAPQGREIASELAWILPISGGYFSSNLFWRQEPGHFESAPNDIGVAFRLQFGF